MAEKKTYRFQLDKGSQISEQLERIPKTLRGEYIILALQAFKPFTEVTQQASYEKSTDKKAMVASSVMDQVVDFSFG